MSEFGNLTQKFDQQKGGMVEFGDDSRLFVEFYSRPVLDSIASKELGKPTHVQMNYIRIQQPGERDRIDRPATEIDSRRFKAHWAAYQEGREVAPAGVPLSVLFPANPEIVENLKVDKIHTVEQLAALTDTQIQNVGMGARGWQQKAAEYLMVAMEGSGLHRLQSQIDQLQAARTADADKIAALEAALDEATKKNRGKAA